MMWWLVGTIIVWAVAAFFAGNNDGFRQHGGLVFVVCIVGPFWPLILFLTIAFVPFFLLFKLGRALSK